ncbi:MAG: hypothetical protein JXP34_14305 [Planctomycetes bacterium]|nr:hypothetical protein [Planctomycetota bacterium]
MIAFPRRVRAALRAGTASLFAALVLAAIPAHGEVIYDATFDGEPTGPLSWQPSTDPLPLHLPTTVLRDAAGTVDVVLAAGDLAQRPVLLTSQPQELANAAFFNPVQLASGSAHVSWDSLVTALPGLAVEAPFSEIAITERRGGTLPAVLSIVYRNVGTAADPKLMLTARDAKGDQDVAGFTIDRHDHFELDLDLDAGEYSLAIDGKPGLRGKLAGDGNFSHIVFCSMSRGSKETAPPLAFDNLLVEAFPRGGCVPIDFEDLPIGTEIPCGTAFVTNGVLARTREYFFGPGGCVNPTAGGIALISGDGRACRKEQELWISNVNVELDYAGPIGGLELYYGEWGGTVNFMVNGSCLSRENFADLPPSLGGVAIEVEDFGEPGQGCGRLVLTGVIHAFAIGGQELAIDDISCIPHDTTPPFAEITSPGTFDCACSPVPIFGTAHDPDGILEGYSLQYTQDAGGAWTEFAHGAGPVVEGLLGSWDAKGLPGGFHVIRLVATNAAGLSASFTTALWLDQGFDSFQVRGPADGDVVGGTVCFDGTIWDHCFEKYSVTFQPSAGGAGAPVDPGHPDYGATVINDPFALWDTSAVPDGKYLVRTAAVDVCGHSPEDERRIVVDNTPPTARITGPAPCTCVEGVVTIEGTAHDANLDGWVLQYTGGDASTWVTIASGSTAATAGTLGTWDTTGLRPCAYTIRLVATDRAVIDCDASRRHRIEYTVSLRVGDCDGGDCCRNARCPNPGDINGDTSLDIGDAIYLLNHLFSDGPTPPPAAPICE